MLTALVALSLVASAQDLRDVRGANIDLDAVPSAVVQWSMQCTTCAAEMRDLTNRGIRVVAVSSDPPQRRSQLVPHLRARGVRASVVADPTGAAWRLVSGQANLPAGETVVWRGLTPTDSEAVAAR
ncbi:MAG: hypothetical protein ACI8PZ_000456 [Myxococcota bacterium]|jgi:hypothetical protein